MGGADPSVKFRIVLAGNRDLPMAKIPRLVVEQLVDARKVLLRRPADARRPIGRFERTVAGMAQALGVEVEWWSPEPGGREQVFLRDLDMVGKADRVVAFFSEAELTGGTGHVVEAAMTKAVPVEAWWVWDDGTTVRIGEYDPWSDGT